uniref:tRNA-dihydrouridine(20) synthase [NAD(P)+]-like n=1 Tax=Schistocephalus solidus TaxID=70667 RepID=A0A0X3PRK6_SCHSO
MASMDFNAAVVLGPMVRVTTHPMRLLALQYGATYVYTEEIIDFKLLRTIRVENAKLRTTDFVHPDGTVVFRTSAEEKGKVILQLGTADAKRALQAAKHVEKDVAGIDVNMGCPKEYSIKVCLADRSLSLVAFSSFLCRSYVVTHNVHTHFT